MSVVPRETEAERKAVRFIKDELKQRIQQGRVAETAMTLDVDEFGVETLSQRSLRLAEAYRIAVALGVQKKFATYLT